MLLFLKAPTFYFRARRKTTPFFLLTTISLQNSPWPKEAIDDFFYLDNAENTLENHKKMIDGLAYVMRSHKIDRIVALDDFDVEKAALLREHFRIAGMGQTTARYFRDKLAMRQKAQDDGIPIPAFSSLFNDVEITEFLLRTAAPWMLKPRSEASATGIKKVNSFQEAWDAVHQLGNERHHYLIEEFKPGKVYHVDTLTVEKNIIFSKVSQYLSPPMEVAHQGGIFRTITIDENSNQNIMLKSHTEKLLQSFGIEYGACHSEFIEGEGGNIYFLETSSRVGGAYIADMVAAATGINVWEEWAKIETNPKSYSLPDTKKEYAGIIISLSCHEFPDYNPFVDEEIIWRLEKKHHIGLIVKANTYKKVEQLLDKYVYMIRDLGYHSSAPAPDKTI